MIDGGLLLMLAAAVLLVLGPLDRIAALRRASETSQFHDRK